MKKVLCVILLGIVSTLAHALGLVISSAHAGQVQPTGGSRTFTFTNQCSSDIWFGISGGSVKSKVGTTTQPDLCNTSDDCYQGSSCIQTGNISHCFWDNPAPANGSYKLTKGQSNTVEFPSVDNGLGLLWSGQIAGRTNCTGPACETASCGSGGNACNPSQGFNSPATLAEFSLLHSGVDTYDISAINGMNVPVKFGPSNASVDPMSPFTCGTSGNTLTVQGLGSCSWSYTTPSNIYRDVLQGGASCSSDSACTVAGEVCGLSFQDVLAGATQTTCGKFLGYWTEDQICGIKPTFSSTEFNCAATAGMPGSFSGTTIANLTGCGGTSGSCYSDGADSNCCGCVNWQDEGVSIPGSPVVGQCAPPSNPAWQAKILPNLTWIKKGCPSYYTYPYDDKSSTFSCNVNNSSSGSTNVASYQVTFCPGGAEGIPTAS